MGTSDKAPAVAPPGLALITTQGHKSFGGSGEEYSLEEVLGEGSYGSVYRCLRARDSAVFACKIIDTMRIGFVGGSVGIKAAEIMAAREVDALRQLSSHAGIISLEAAFFSQATRQIFIVTDFVPGSHLFSHIVQRSTALKEPEASHIVAQLSDAVSFCHALGVVHRDLKLENVLVAAINVRLAEHRDAETGVAQWQTEEIFTVKICDFGFAKSLQAFTTKTPIGTGTYAAPEVKVDRIVSENDGIFEKQTTNERQTTGASLRERQETRESSDGTYDAFKADAFSLGVMMFVMLCLGFPSKDRKRRYLHRSHKLWPLLSPDAQSLIDGLLDADPSKRLGIIQAHNHPWVKFIEEEVAEEDAARRKSSQKTVLDHAEEETGIVCKRNPQPRWQHQPSMQDPALPGVLALHRALVHIQQERGMACWALAGSPGMGGISCWDQLQWHVQLTEKRIHEAKTLLKEKEGVKTRGQVHPTDALFSILTRARKSTIDCASMDGYEGFDGVFLLYNQACGALIEIVATAMEEVRPGSAESRRAARRYRLFSAAAEQLSRERAFICGHGCRVGVCPLKPKLEQPIERLHRLAEIIGARKILLGTVVDDSDIVTTSAGLLGTLIGKDEPSLLGQEDIALLESLERRVLQPSIEEALPMEEFYQTITRFLNEIHSRIAINLVDDMRLKDSLQRSSLDESPTGRATNGAVNLPSSSHSLATYKQNSCGCRAGLKRYLHTIVDKL